MTEHVKTILNTEMVEEAFKLRDEQLLRPEGRIAILLWQVRGLAVAELVVEDDRNGMGGG